MGPIVRTLLNHWTQSFLTFSLDKGKRPNIQTVYVQCGIQWERSQMQVTIHCNIIYIYVRIKSIKNLPINEL